MIGPFGAGAKSQRGLPASGACCQACRHGDDLSRHALERRRAFLERHANRAVLVLGTHFATPTGGRILRDGKHWRFEV